MIIFRYLAREVLVTLSAISAVLLVIIISGRFVKYMAKAAQGMSDPFSLLLIIGYRIPEFLQLILPLGLFLGILLAYGRLYLESEMAVLTASGISQQRIFIFSLLPATLVAIVLAALSLQVTPYGIRQVEIIVQQEDSVTEFDSLSPGRFQPIKQGERVVYAEEISAKRERLRGVFVSETGASKQQRNGEASVLIAKSGKQIIHDDGSRYLVLEDGYRYDGVPGHADYRRIKYDTYAVLMPRPTATIAVFDHEAMRTSELLVSDVQKMKTELHWRISIPVLAFVVTLIAVPLARVNPRQGRFLKLLPAILLYLAYLALLIAARDALDKGKIPNALGMWPVHLLFTLIGVGLLYWNNFTYWWAGLRTKKQAVQNA